MPTYLYECKSCGRFEKFQNIKDEPLEECPECGGKVKRIIGAPGIIFKGSNFYVNQENKKSEKKEKKNKENTDKAS
ncbi:MULTISPECIES: FmdB family zinc ribbon protein [unclassified Halanaerobium]|uniref:FmdB family zinc ribbon protein n=1 Tax=unclassified Halanaerobium TaxID=2641197 RepID=UPI000DF1C3FC|nr:MULTISPECIES: FmdB family zinc ribbon protein [unclassified Halanaerobium]RCW49204.1 putative FmdB family regulatory protein [Halanaerobium sp. MA284_MarDTE_T2]RCW82965.1 putative FmdB family regulatory protein [Halanaerobium sp. DL-01]